MIKQCLSSFAKVVMGQSPSGKSVNTSGDGIPLLNGPSEFTTHYPIPKQFTVDAQRFCKPGDILFCVRGSTTGRMNWADQKYAVGRGLAAISHKKGKNYNSFLKYLLDYNLPHLLNSTSGSTFPNLSTSILNSFQFVLPSEKDQLVISNFLSKIDSKIELNNRINSELEGMAKLIYDYWFVQFDFPISEGQAAAMGRPELKGKPYKSSGGKMIFNRELKRDVPEGWVVKRLKSFIKKDKSGDWGKEDSEGNYVTKVACIRGADLNGLNGNGDLKCPTRYILEKNDHKILESGDFIIEISGGSPTQSTGRMAFITDSTLERFETPLICSNFCKALTLKNIDALYYFAYKWKRIYDNRILFGWEGKTSGIKNFLFDAFVSSYKTDVAPNDLVKNYFILLEPIQSKIQKNLKGNQTLTELRDWLLPMLMNGQVRVLGGEGELKMAAEPGVKYGAK